MASPETELGSGVSISSFPPPWVSFVSLGVLGWHKYWLKPDLLWSGPPAGAKPCDARRAERLGRAEDGGSDQSVPMGTTRSVFCSFLPKPI